MKNFFDYMRENCNIEVPKGNLPSAWFAKNNLPMVVMCTCCEMTMALPSAFIDDEGDIYCSDCSGVSEG